MPKRTTPIKKLEELRAYRKRNPLAHGGQLRNLRKGRAHGRPLSTRESMHLVLRSQKAVGTQSFRRPGNDQKIRAIVKKFSGKYGVKIHGVGNAKNHLHLHIQLRSRRTYKPFIRAVTAAIAMAITGASRWNKAKEKFWDYRPFSRVVAGSRKAWFAAQNYVEMNDLEGTGVSRLAARWVMEKERTGFG